MTIFTNKYGDTIEYTYYGHSRINGIMICQCTARARTGDKEKVFKSLQAAKNFINKERGQETIFGETREAA